MGIKYNTSMYAAIGISVIAAGAVTLMLTPVLGPLSVAAAGVSTIPIVSQIAMYSVSAIAYGGSALGMFFGWTVIALPIVKGAEILYDNLISPAMIGMSNLVGNIASWFKSSTEAERKALQEESERLAKEKAEKEARNSALKEQIKQVDEAQQKFDSRLDLSKPAGHADDKVNERAADVNATLQQVSSAAASIGLKSDFSLDDLEAVLNGGGQGRDMQ